MSKIGRPTKYNKSMLPVIIELMEQGASQCEVCAELGICEQTLTRWCKASEGDYIPEFSEAIKAGTRLSAAWWERNGRINLQEEYSKSHNVITPMDIYNSKYISIYKPL